MRRIHYNSNVDSILSVSASAYGYWSGKPSSSPVWEMLLPLNDKVEALRLVS